MPVINRDSQIGAKAVKYSNLRAFEKHLESASPSHFSELYLILIKDAFERKSAADRLIKSLLEGSRNPELALRVFDGERLSVEDVCEELNSFSFFAEKRIVAIHGIDKLPKTALAKLEESFSQLNRSICLVLSGASMAANTRFYKKAEQAGVLLEIAEEKPWEKEKSAVEWVLTKVNALGKKIHPAIAQALIKQVGTDYALLHQEIEKINCYIGERNEIALQDINAVSVHVNSENAWQLGEAIFQRDVQAGLRISKALLSEGQSFLTLLRQVRTQLQTDFQVCAVLSQGGGAEQVTQLFPYMKGFILERHMRMAQSYGLERFKKGLQKVDEIELLAKSSGADPELLAEMLIVKLM